MKAPMKWTVALVALVALALVGVFYRGHAESAFAAESSPAAAVASDAPVVTVYKNPSCACCGEWAEHLKESGFQVEIEEARWDLMQIKAEHGVPPEHSSCHTAVVEGYVLEGHVPADLVQQLLRERPEIRGLAVPGMPAGVPGMPEAGPNRAPYEVLAIQPDGSTSVYATR